MELTLRTSQVRPRVKIGLFVYRFWDGTNNWCKPKFSWNVCWFRKVPRSIVISRSVSLLPRMVKVRPNKVTERTCDILFRPCGQNSVMISISGLTQGQVKVMSKWSNFVIQNFLPKNGLYCISCLTGLKKSFILTCNKNANNCLSKSDVFSFTWFYCTTPEGKIMLWDFVHFLPVYKFILSFSNKFKILNLLDFIFLKKRFWEKSVSDQF